MLLNNEAVLHIIEAHFADAVEYEILTSIMGMDGYDLSEHFDELVDYGDLGGINEITVTEFEFEKDGGEVVISGMLSVEAVIDGYVHWDGEDNFVESCEMKMEFKFSFEIAEGQYREFEMEYLW